MTNFDADYFNESCQTMKKKLKKNNSMKQSNHFFSKINTYGIV